MLNKIKGLARIFAINRINTGLHININKDCNLFINGCGKTMLVHYPITWKIIK